MKIRIQIIVLGALVACFIGTLLSGFAVVHSEAPGIVYYGFPYPWREVYGGVTVKYNFIYLLYDLFGFFAGSAVILAFVTSLRFKK